MREKIKEVIKEHIIRPALRSFLNPGLSYEAIMETLKEEEFEGFVESVRQQVPECLKDALAESVRQQVPDRLEAALKG